MPEEELVSTFLSFRLSGNKRYSIGELVSLRFSLTNSSNRDVWVLSWLTPLEGLAGNILTVVCDGEALPYEGIMAARGNPGKGDYVRIGPKKTVTKDFDLSSSYRFRPCCECEVQFGGHILDVCIDEREIPRNLEQFKPADIKGNGFCFEIYSQR